MKKNKDLLHGLAEAVRQHKLRIDQQIKQFIDQGLKKGSIEQTDFTLNERGQQMFFLFDQSGVPIEYNYSTARVHKYGTNFNVR